MSEIVSRFPWSRRVNRIPFLASSYPAHCTNIFDAAKDRTVDEVRYFIEQRGVSVNSSHKNGITPLHLAAAFNDRLEVLVYLISRGADINATNVLGSTPLHYAANFTANSSVIHCLIHAGAFVNARRHPPDGQTPLDMADYNRAPDHRKIRSIIVESGGMRGTEL